MPRRVSFLRILAIAGLALPGAAGPLPAIEPGVDIAAPRVAITTVDSALAFHPSRVVVEQGDHARWVPLVVSIHTTTSGAPCVADGRWSASLGTPGVNFTRQFAEPPQVFPYFCSPHCGLGMQGQVTVTTLIDLATTDSSGTPKLSWTGGGASYQVFRSDTPAFTGPNTVKLTPDGGSAGMTLTDLSAPQPATGRANFYLVMNLF
jgi:plastocyanin